MILRNVWNYISIGISLLTVYLSIGSGPDLLLGLAQGGERCLLLLTKRPANRIISSRGIVEIGSAGKRIGGDSGGGGCTAGLARGSSDGT